MAGINRVILVGNLGADPEIRTLENGTKVAQFSLATAESYRDKAGEWQEQTEWHRIVLWRFLAEKAEKSLKKGSKIYLEGKIRSRSWTNQESVKQYTTEIIGEKYLLLDKREGGQDFSPSPSSEDIPAQQVNKPAVTEVKINDPEIAKTSDTEDDLPF